MITACVSWFIHSSADWMWQLAAVTLPAMMLFGGLLAVGGPGWAVASAGASAGARASGGPAPSDPADSEPARPAGRHTPAHAKQGSRPRRSLWSPRATAWVAAVLAFAVILSAAFPYLSLRFSGMAAGSSDLALVDSRTNTAAKLDPTAMHPYATRASAYTIAALKQPEGSTQRADDLRMAATAWIDAVKHQPNIWLNNYMAAQTLLTARDAATAAGKTADAKLFGQWAQTYLDQAKTLNPLSPQVKTLQAKLNTVVAPATTAATTSP